MSEQRTEMEPLLCHHCTQLLNWPFDALWKYCFLHKFHSFLKFIAWILLQSFLLVTLMPFAGLQLFFLVSKFCCFGGNRGLCVCVYAHTYSTVAICQVITWWRTFLVFWDQPKLLHSCVVSLGWGEWKSPQKAAAGVCACTGTQIIFTVS